jgi:hypothetical protein
VSKKSHPGDGTHNCGTKGGALYGSHFAVANEQEARSLVRSIVGLVRLLRQH